MIAYRQKQIEDEQGDDEEHGSSLKFYQNHMEELPGRIEKMYQLYVYFCENFLEKLFAEERLYLRKFNTQGESENEPIRDFFLQWHRVKREQEQKQKQPNPSKTRRKRKSDS